MKEEIETRSCISEIGKGAAAASAVALLSPGLQAASRLKEKQGSLLTPAKCSFSFHGVSKESAQLFSSNAPSPQIDPS